ncbi:hypothetical protein RHSIM_Rhsim03G0255000 [Rhododendron simsii]|uniref:PLATZ transcription factor family protein n=1 Tax=Rhododendron simsii TaxID=118357 RepID=A0A834H9C4_RHOSS|nr:hypothetical protein RHSIM_Rhsim03G0255000 [Rhododendron simsii]
MVGSPLHAEVLHFMPNSRELEEEREKRILLGLLHKYLPSLRALPSISQARSSSSLRISRCRPAYTINSAKVVFIKKRPQNRQFKGSGNYCTSCDRSLQEPYIHCSLGCKVDFLVKHYKDLSPYIRPCHTLQLSPDFFVPQEMGDDEMTNETPHSTIVDGTEYEPMCWSSGSSGSETMSVGCTTSFVRKKRSGLYLCGRSATKVSAEEEDMATCISRRKGIPHRSPLC